MTGISDNAMEQSLTSAMKSCETSALRVAKYFEGTNDRGMHMGKLYNVMESYCMLESRSRASAECLNEARNMDPEEDSILSFKELFHQRMEEKIKTLGEMKEHPKYIQFDKKIKQFSQAANDEGEEELLVTEAHVNDIDPISQRVMMHPVKNLICGHAYEKDTILTVLKSKKLIRCPYAGCANTTKFSAKDLEDDEELEEILRLRRLQKE